MKGLEKYKSRFLNKLTKSENGCINWTAYKNKSGYGIIKCDGKNYKTHRLSWIFNFGKIPNGLCVLHMCDNPSCVNVKHLFLGTYYDNYVDMVKKGRDFKLVHKSGDFAFNKKLNSNDVKKIRNLLNKCIAQKHIAKIYNVRQSTISLIKTGLIWRTI